METQEKRPAPSAKEQPATPVQSTGLSIIAENGDERKYELNALPPELLQMYMEKAELAARHYAWLLRPHARIDRDDLEQDALVDLLEIGPEDPALAYGIARVAVLKTLVQAGCAPRGLEGVAGGLIHRHR